MQKKQSTVMVIFLLSFFLGVFFPAIQALAAVPVTPHGTARFETNTATINITQNSAVNRRIWTQAIQAWNRTGAFNFIITTTAADISAQADTKLGVNYTGMTFITINQQGYLDHVDAEINPQAFKVYRYSKFEMVNVAEHELGHSIGLNHNPNRASVMYAANRYYGIQAVDIAGVNQFYSSQADSIRIPDRSATFRDPVTDGKKNVSFDKFDPLSFSVCHHTPFVYQIPHTLVEELIKNFTTLSRLAYVYDG
ncbi:hypothetical protein YK48G_08640 [Lentilactobacillus fungorum]|uniref:Peptidase M10 metallopeptidase domain-containing protein n=1 Tax=Lentilactobacillus fungorum TaxID=2201250 RepID=A0ABQ3VYL8_9LACO|nr:matrixin family metalloprotease [Lentilactobacillus fungorum]GHP13439.1 hypothetical protein YK48G_08640 [Lentilactobacillus fungorum]